ncbi:unnamed protein product, partial [Discosporangium mesarthrocarpum]
VVEREAKVKSKAGAEAGLDLREEGGGGVSALLNLLAAPKLSNVPGVGVGVGAQAGAQAGIGHGLLKGRGAGLGRGGRRCLFVCYLPAGHPDRCEHFEWGQGPAPGDGEDGQQVPLCAGHGKPCIPLDDGLAQHRRCHTEGGFSKLLSSPSRVRG